MKLTAGLLDWGIIILLIVSLLVGLLRGFVRESISLVTWIAAVFFAIAYFPKLAEHLPFTLNSEVAHLGIAFAIIFMGVLVVGAIINYLMVSVTASIGLKPVDHIFGAVFGIFRVALIVGLLIILVELTTWQEQVWWKDSRVIPWFDGVSDWIMSIMPQQAVDYLENGELIPPEQQGNVQRND